MRTSNYDKSRTDLALELFKLNPPVIITADMDHPLVIERHGQRGIWTHAHEKNPDLPLSQIYANLRTGDNPKPGPLPYLFVNWIAACMKGVLEAEYVEDKDPATGRAKKPIGAIAAVPYAGEPFADVLARTMYGVPRLAHAKGECEGMFAVAGRELPPPGSTVLIVDDVLSTGDSKMLTIECARRAGYTVTDVVVFLDRESGGVEYLHGEGLSTHAVWKLSDLVTWYREQDVLSSEMYKRIVRGLESHS